MADISPRTTRTAQHDVDDADNRWMGRALELARQGMAAGEVPVGAVLVWEGEVLGEGWNRPISAQDPSAHAEIIALRAASQKLGNYRLPGTTLYVSLEPCLMCIGAMIHARITRLVFGAYDPRSDTAGSVASLLSSGRTNHQVAVNGGIRETECAEILRSFFAARRKA